MRKVLVVLLAAIMAFSLTACNSDKPSQSMNTEKPAATGASDAEKDKSYNVVMEIPILGAEPSGLADVEAAINAYVEPKIGVNVTLTPITLQQLASQTNLMISSDDKLDLVCDFASGVGDLVNKEALLPLDDLYEKYGQDIKKSAGITIAGGYLEGKLYAIPSEEKHARSYGFAARKDIVDQLGFHFDKDKVYTTDDLTKLFHAYKEKYGEGYYCVAGTTPTTENYTNMYRYDSLGSTSATGILMGAGLDGDTTVTNLYDTKEYENYAKLMYDWAKAGYYSPDAATNTEAGTVQLQSGYYLGQFQSLETDMAANISRDCGYEMIPISLTGIYAETSMYQVSMWSIPSTCENPEKTFQFLNMLYADNDLDNILTYGLEGKSYEIVQKGEKEGQAVIKYPEGVNAANTPYNMPLHVFGDKITISVFEPTTLDYYKEAEEFNNSITDAQKSITLGYTFNAYPIATQLAAVSSVVQQYSGIVSTGAQNPADVLPEFRKALKDAGIEDIIKENQSQLSQWLTEHKK